MCGRKLKEVRLDGSGRYLKGSTVFPLSARISSAPEEYGYSWKEMAFGKTAVCGVSGKNGI